MDDADTQSIGATSMAIYEYEVLDSEGTVVGIFEAEQKMSDATLTQHPETGQPLRRILSATFAHGSHAETASACASGSCPMAGGFDSGGCCGGGGCTLN
jgi:predicted nucleic acid-binding Zn ribbon protein